MSYSPPIRGVYIIYPWQSVSVPASGSASPTGTSFTALASGTLEVYCSLPSGVTATLSITTSSGVTTSISLPSGYTKIPINQGDSISISFSNSNTSAATAIITARVIAPY